MVMGINLCISYTLNYNLFHEENLYAAPGSTDMFNVAVRGKRFDYRWSSYVVSSVLQTVE